MRPTPSPFRRLATLPNRLLEKQSTEHRTWASHLGMRSTCQPLFPVEPAKLHSRPNEQHRQWRAVGFPDEDIPWFSNHPILDSLHLPNHRPDPHLAAHPLSSASTQVWLLPMAVEPSVLLSALGPSTERLFPSRNRRGTRNWSNPPVLT